MNKLIITTVLVLASLSLLTSCSEASELTRPRAMKLLKQKYPVGEEIKTFYICTKDVTEKTTHLCENAKIEFNYEELISILPDGFEEGDDIFAEDVVLFLTKYGSTRRAGESGIGRHSFRYIYALNEKVLKKAEPFMRHDKKSSRVDIVFYHYKLNEITGIRDATDNSKCDKIVEYNYKRSNLSPWAEDYLTYIKKAPDIYQACFVKYDDGWRIK